MYTIEDYLSFRGELSFESVPVNEIDEMLFASLGKPDYTGILKENETGRFSEVFSEFFARHDEKENERLGLLASPVLVKTLHTASQDLRYSGIEISHFINKISTERTEQISALTVLGPQGRVYVTFRGTDDTLVGWKENCEFAILDSVPAQRDAADYLSKIAQKFSGPIVVAGHSKGGNLALYAAANACAEVQQRIEKVISYDGPGFQKAFLETSGYMNIKNKITTMLPAASIVGMLMKHAGDIDVIECEKSGPAAHDIFTWSLAGSSFVRAGSLSEKSLLFHKAINQTLEELNTAERQALVDGLFDALSSTGATRLMDFTEHSFAQALKVAGEFQRNKEIKQFIVMLSHLTIKGAVNNTLEDIQEKIQDRVIESMKERIEELKDTNKQEKRDRSEASDVRQ